MSEELNELGLRGLAKQYLSELAQLREIYRQKEEVNRRLTAADDALKKTVIQLGAQVVNHRAHKPLNISMGDGTLVRVTCDSGYSADNARVYVEPIVETHLR